MTEWGVIGVLVTLVGLVTAIVAPILKLNGTITRLSAILDHALKRLEKLEETDGKRVEERRRSHEKIYDKIGEHDKTLQDHETRLEYIEKGEHK